MRGVGLSIGTLMLVASGSAHAIPLPDNSSCSSSSNYCFRITNTANHSNAISGNATGNGIGVMGSSPSGYGVIGTTNGSATAVMGTAFGSSGTGVWGFGYGTNSAAAGVKGECPGNSGGCVGVKGTVRASSGGTAVFGDAANSGSAWAAYFVGDVSALNYFNNSDARLKKNVKGMSQATESILKLRPVTYQWKHDAAGGAEQLGLIAQEVQQVFPSAVRADANSGMLGVNYTAMVPVLIKSVQEQQETIQRLQSQISAMERARAPMLQSSMTSPATLLGAGLGLIPLALVQAFRRRKNA